MGCGASSAELTAERIGKALVEALNQAAVVSVQTCSKPGTFKATPALKVQMPNEGIGAVMEKAKGLPGIGSEVQDLEDKMNEAAEQSCGRALPILQQAINGLNFQNARAILDGPANAATDHFIKLCREPLFNQFKPIVNDKLKDCGSVKVYDTIISAYNKLPFTDDAPAWDMEEHVTNQALKGLFTMFEQEEAKIRGNPAAAPSELLQDVFGQAKKQ